MSTTFKSQALITSLLSCSLVALLSGCKTEEAKPVTTPFPHSDNVFAARSNWYVNPTWSNKASQSEGSAIAQQSTAIWLDSIAEIETIEAGEIPNIPGLEDGESPTDLGLREHLQEAEKQGNALVQLVLYGLPGRDCASVASLGELPASEYGLEVYQTHYIDRIAKIINDFKHIPIAVTVEPYSLAYSVINSQYEACQEVSNEKSWGYTNAIRYAINTLFEYENVHLYLDISASNKLGWDADLALTSLYYHGVLTGFDDTLYRQALNLGEEIEAADGATGKYEEIERIFMEPPEPTQGDTSAPWYYKIDGFISNVADYIPLEEPYLGDPLLPDGPAPLRSAYFYDWNPRVDEFTFTEDWLASIQQLSNIRDTYHLGMLIDTSRNGWGQAHIRLQDATPTQDPKQVNDHRIDQREHRENWCNQPSGIGKRPQIAPEDKPWLDAYVWVKQPGVSDGISDPNFEIDPSWPSKGGWDPSCDPEELSTFGQQYDSTKDLNLGTGAMADAPRPGRWFEAGFKTLLDNAWPPLCDGHNDQCK